MRGQQVTNAATVSWLTCRQHRGPCCLSLFFAQAQVRPRRRSPEVEEGSSQRLHKDGYDRSHGARREPQSRGRIQSACSR